MFIKPYCTRLILVVDRGRESKSTRKLFVSIAHKSILVSLKS